MPNVSSTTISDFSQLFTGHKQYYGTSTLTKETKDSGKKVAKSYTKSVRKGDEPLTLMQYRAHLEGERGLGVAPIDENNNCRFAVIDIDTYPLNPEDYITLCVDYDLPFCFFRSKSGGLHCYMFFNEDVKANKVRELMMRMVIIFGLPKTTEIFPKQERLFDSSSPSWINLPYYGGSESYMYMDSGEPLSIDHAIQVCKHRRINAVTLEQKLDDLPINDGPICLQSLYMRSNSIVDGDGRNNYLFNLGIYYKVKDSQNMEELIMLANNKLLEPKEESAILSQIVAPISKKTYSYRCNDGPLCDNCHPEMCKERKYGKGGDEISSLSFEELTQVLTDPPHYVWIVNGQEMVFYKESELREQYAFADQCMRLLHIVPNRLKPQRWVSVLNKAFADIKTKEINLEDDMSPGALLWTYFTEYITERARAQNREQIAMGYIFHDEERSMYVFKRKFLVPYLQNDKNFRYFTTGEIQKRLFDRGVVAMSYYIKPKRSERVWTLHDSKLQPTERREKANEVDFNDMKPEQEF